MSDLPVVIFLLFVLLLVWARNKRREQKRHGDEIRREQERREDEMRREQERYQNEILNCDSPLCGGKAPRRQMAVVWEAHMGRLVNYCPSHDNRCGLPLDADKIPPEPAIQKGKVETKS